MFCPGCGSTNSIDQKFCRSCGLNLEMTAASVIEQFPDGSRSELQKQEQRLERFGNVAFGGFGVVAGLGICGMIYYIFVKMVLSGTQPLAGLLLAAFVVFAGLSLAYVVWNETLKEKRKKIEPAPGRGAALPSSTGQLLDEGRFEPVPSVTEDTTRLLKVERKTRDLN